MMIKKIDLKIFTDANIYKKSKIIYSSKNYNNICFALNENLIDYSFSYDYAALAKSDKEILYILFTGKKIKQEIYRKKTLITIKKLKYDGLLDDLASLDGFEINQYYYKLENVENLFPCSLLYAEGGIFDANEIHSAIFFPYFMENRDVDGKSTLIFVNIMYERFKIISKHLFESLGFEIFLDEKKINLDCITQEDISKWIILHEYVHNSGPLSLFTSNANKFSTKKYGFIEEMRVDLTSIMIILDKLCILDSNYTKIIVIILLERLFRGALYNFQSEWNFSKNEMFAKEVEGDVSIAFMILLDKYNILDFQKKKINLNQKNMQMLLEEVLSDIYKYEQLAYLKQAFSSSATKFAAYFRDKYLKVTPAVTNFLKEYSVQNCLYKIFFIH